MLLAPHHARLPAPALPSTYSQHCPRTAGNNRDTDRAQSLHRCDCATCTASIERATAPGSVLLLASEMNQGCPPSPAHSPSLAAPLSMADKPSCASTDT